MNYYELLGVHKNASKQDLKKAYKKLIKKYHPDVYEGKKETAEEKVKQINEAYDTLSNDELRKEYDAKTFPEPDVNEKNFGSSYSNIDFSQSNNYETPYENSRNSDRRYDDLYRYDYYKRYTTKYYGVSRDDLNKDKQRQVRDSEAILPSLKMKILILIGLALMIICILLIALLSVAKDSIENGIHHVPRPNSVDDSYEYEHHHSGITVDFGMTFTEIEQALGAPSFKEYRYGKLYAYWGNSYIIFDNNDIVIGWANDGSYFYTEATTGEDEKIFHEIQNYINSQ